MSLSSHRSANPSNDGFTDVEMGPLLGQTAPSRNTHNHRKSTTNSSIKSPSLLENDNHAYNLEDVETSEQHEQQHKKRFQLSRTGNLGGIRNPKDYGGKVMFAATMYSFCSVSMVLTNKSLTSSYNHLIDGDLNVLLVIFQSIISVICVQICKALRWVEYPAFDIRTAKLWASVNLFFCAMLFTSMASLQHNSVPIVTVFKNIANIITCMGDYYFFNTHVGPLVIVAFVIMLGGAVLAALNDAKVTLLGVFWLVANCLSVSGYVLYMKFAIKNVKLSKFGMVFYNNVLCVIFLFPASVIMGEFGLFVTSASLHTPEYFLKNLFAGFIGFFLNFASLNCVSQTGPTTYAIIGSLNKIPTTFLGCMIFAENITRQTWFFICVSISGGFIYSYAKIKENKRRSGRSG